MTRWDLFREMENMSREMNNVIKGFECGSKTLEKLFFPELKGNRLPRVNVSHDKDSVYVETLLPGVKPEDVEMNVLYNTLTLSGDRTIENDPEGKPVYHRRERGEGKFRRTIEFPYEIDATRAEAEFKDGLLRVTLPKAEKAKPKKVLLKAA